MITSEYRQRIGGTIAFIDCEVGADDKKIHDIGAVTSENIELHTGSVRELEDFLLGSEYICGHNIIAHDLKYLLPVFSRTYGFRYIDTLCLSPLLFPERPYHALLKDDKLIYDELNNPLNDAKKARSLFYDEINAFSKLDLPKKRLFFTLLGDKPEFSGFFRFVGFDQGFEELSEAAHSIYAGMICAESDIESLASEYPVELAYALALVGTNDHYSITPPWLTKSHPQIETVMKFLRSIPCGKCDYCRGALDIHKKLREFFGYDSFRTYNGEPLQEKAAQAAVDGRSLLAVFPTGGGKSITFQLPALIAGRAERGLTVVISPLQSLMKDQVDNLSEKGIVDAVTVNGMLSPIERSEAIARVAEGLASLLYISPEQLRSKTVERLLLSRNVVRFVIDEAHCFSAWGQDFRVDYLYIGDFIRKLQKKKGLDAIPVSCFTATAKQKVISDIRDYFQNKLGIRLELFTTNAERENLHYSVIFKETEDQKYATLRELVESKNCPTIVYVSRVKRTYDIAARLTGDGFPAKPYNGKMESNDKIAVQEAFAANEVKIIVATSAFGMGVDKKDVGLVVHYDISDSLENYVQEAGRAGRDPKLEADCYVLYNDNDLNKHFILLNQTKLSISEIQQVWKAIKDLTRERASVCVSPLEIARQAGWDDSGSDMETRVKTAVAALESAGYIRRGQNVPHVYATSILAKNMEEASFRIDRSQIASDAQKINAKRIIKSLISSRSIAKAGNDDAESRVDYLADTLGLEKSEVVSLVELMRRDGLLADSQDMTAYIMASDTKNRSLQILERFAKIERFVLEKLAECPKVFSLKKVNDSALEAGLSFSSIKMIRTILFYLTIKNYISRPESVQSDDAAPFSDCAIALTDEFQRLIGKFGRRIDICRFVVSELFRRHAVDLEYTEREELPVQFSLVGLWKAYLAANGLTEQSGIALGDVEDSLLYLSKIGAMKLEGGFLVLYSGMELTRLIRDNKIRYKVDDYKALSEYYKQKIQQIHIVGEYANLMVKDYNAALLFVKDYFGLDYRKFIQKYFAGERAKEIERNITPEKYEKLFGDLSAIQSEIINDSSSKYIVVAAGPGSGKTRVLVHKLASLMLLEDVKHEQLLMVTFSRAAATEFKKRLIDLIGNAAAFVEIKTFHSYCFDLLGKIGSLESSDRVVSDAAELIENGEVEPNRIAKTVLVIDEAQDMDASEFALVKALMKHNDDMRVIAVGDDDQNIYAFRRSDSKYMRSLIDDFGAVRYEMVENYRSRPNIVALANAFAGTITDRMKTRDVSAVQTDNGIVRITRHSCENMEIPLAEEVRTEKGKTVCVLTSTNDEALRILGLLTKRGVKAKLIQSLKGFSLYNLAEIRYFLKQIDKSLDSPTISDENWSNSKKALMLKYSGSSCLNNCLVLISEFEKTNRVRYRTDLEEFIRESNYEDFYGADSDSVLVSTIHKSKGREFDRVCIMLKNVTADNDETRRAIYVGMTRAKSELYIHTNRGIFDQFDVPGVEKVDDRRYYPEPEEITLQLTHEDVVLDFFKGRKQQLLGLRSGMPLRLDGVYLSVTVNGVEWRAAKLSKKCLGELDRLNAKGYLPVRASIRFIVAWRGKEDSDETAVILADIDLSASGGRAAAADDRR